MDVFKIDDLIHALNSARNDGYEYVEVSIVGADEGEPANLVFDYIVDSTETVTEFIDGVKLPSGYSLDI